MDLVFHIFMYSLNPLKSTVCLFIHLFYIPDAVSPPFPVLSQEVFMGLLNF